MTLLWIIKPVCKRKVPMQYMYRKLLLHQIVEMTSERAKDQMSRVNNYITLFGVDVITHPFSNSWLIYANYCWYRRPKWKLLYRELTVSMVCKCNGNTIIWLNCRPAMAQWRPGDCSHKWDITWICKMISHFPLDKMAAISQPTYSSAFLWLKSFVFWFKLHWSLFLMVQLIIIQHWFK